MVAYHYPPIHESSGVQRTLAFSHYLRDHGWDSIILTVKPRTYQAVDDSFRNEVEEGITVKRTFALDAGRDLAIRGRYPGILAVPDRWVSWWGTAVPAAMRLIREFRPQAIWSTYPIATAHLIALTVQRISNLPWIADFRDLMTEHGFPSDPRTFSKR